jgi:hypothetical protein
MVATKELEKEESFLEGKSLKNSLMIKQNIEKRNSIGKRKIILRKIKLVLKERNLVHVGYVKKRDIMQMNVQRKLLKKRNKS